MLEYALTGERKYWTLLAALAAVIGIGFFFYLRQNQVGLTITGMSRDVTWGFYIAQFTFLVGIAASAVMVVLPYYLHDWKEFGRITALGEFLAISAVILCMPTTGAPRFWGGYWNSTSRPSGQWLRPRTTLDDAKQKDVLAGLRRLTFVTTQV